MSKSSKNLTLAAAAEALVEAASMEVDTVTQKKLSQNLDSLKASFDSNLNKIVQSVQSSNENFDSKINTLNQHVTGVKNEIGAIKSLLEEEKKQKTLERALSMTDLEAFEYFEKEHYRRNTEDLAKKAIKWFMLGYGFNISAGNSTQQYGRDGSGKEEFRKKFKEQIKTLIKREPRMVINNNGSCVIYYS